MEKRRMISDNRNLFLTAEWRTSRMQKECENEMEKLLNDVDEALDLLTENRMAEIWKDNVKLKELSEQMAEAERKYQELDLPEKIKSAIDDLMMSSGRLGS